VGLVRGWLFALSTRLFFYGWAIAEGHVVLFLSHKVGAHSTHLSLGLGVIDRYFTAFEVLSDTVILGL